MSQESLNGKPNDRLSDLWRSGASSSSGSQDKKEGEEMLTMVIERTRSFDRKILLRNVREVPAALIVTGVFAWFAWKAPSGLETIGDVIVAVGGVWITYYLLRFGGGPRRLDPGVSLNAYSQLLRESYDQQIRLLRNVKYWYLLPMYVGLAVAAVGAWLRLHGEGKSPWGPVVSMVIVTCVFCGGWILNEVYAVRCLERLKRELKGME